MTREKDVPREVAEKIDAVDRAESLQVKYYSSRRPASPFQGVADVGFGAVRNVSNLGFEALHNFYRLFGFE